MRANIFFTVLAGLSIICVVFGQKTDFLKRKLKVESEVPVRHVVPYRVKHNLSPKTTRQNDGRNDEPGITTGYSNPRFKRTTAEKNNKNEVMLPVMVYLYLIGINFSV